jgi:hypothetical protein
VVGDYLKNPKTKLFDELDNKLFAISPESIEKHTDISNTYQKVGALIANSILYMENIEVMLSRNTFNFLVDKKPNLNDLKDEHTHFYNTYLMYKKYKIEDPSVFESLEQYFTISDYNGKEIPICKNGDKIKLTHQNIEQWVGEITNFKLHKEIEK